MKPILPVLVAGGTFAATAIFGLLCGILAAGRFNAPLLVPAGLLVGAGIGAFSALRLLFRALR